MRKRFRMKILLFMDNYYQRPLVSAWGNALSAGGNSIQIFSQMDAMYSTTRILSSPVTQKICRWFLLGDRSWGMFKSLPVNMLSPLFMRARDEMNQAFLETSRKWCPKLVIVFKGLGIYPETIEYLRKRMGCVVINFNGDDPHNMHSSNCDILDSIPAYDYHFTWSKRLIPIFLKAGAKSVQRLPFGYDSCVPVCKKISLND